MSNFLAHLYEDGEAVWEGRTAVYGHQKLHCVGDTRSHLPLSKATLKGWNQLAPGSTKAPVAEEIIFWLAHWGIQQHETEFSCAVCLQFNTYLRPGVVVELTTDNVVPAAPNAGRAYAGVWALNLAPATEHVTTKTGTFDESVLIGDVCHHWLNDMMRLLYNKAMNGTGHGQSTRLFPTLTLNRYERLFRRCCAALGLGKLNITPHVVRHSGASNDRFHKRRPLREVKKRGHWKADASVARYEKAALVLSSWKGLTDEQQRAASAAAGQLATHLLRALRPRLR